MIANTIAREVAHAAHDKLQTEPTARENTEIAKRHPHYVVKETLGITPKDLATEIPAVDSSLLLKYICKILTTYARFSKPEHVVTIALWIAGTWFVEPTEHGMIDGQLCFEAFPRLFLIGDPSAGKNRVMKILRKLVRNPTVIGTVKVTSYGVQRALEDGMTVFIDEYHKWVGTQGTRNPDLQQAVLAYSREAGAIDGKQGKYNEYAAFGPVVLAAQPKIESGNRGEELQDLFERSFIIRMQEHDDPDDVIPDLDENFEADCEELRIAMELWAAGIYETVLAGRKSKKYVPVHSMPRVLTSRQREISIPLLFVSDIAVDPDVLAEHGEDTLWAEMARNAVLVTLRGRGDNVAAVMGSLAAKFRDEDDITSSFVNNRYVPRHQR